MDKELLERLNNQDWEAIIKQLTSYAQMKLAPLKWNKGTGATLGKQTEDFVNEAITRVYENKPGKRKWNYKKQPDLLKHLKGIVSSSISNAVNGKENETNIRLNPTDTEDESLLSIISYFEDPEEKVIADEISGLIEKAIQDTKDDTLEMVWYAVIEYELTPEQISKNLGIEKKEVYNTLKRMRRLAQKIIESYQSN